MLVKVSIYRDLHALAVAELIKIMAYLDAQWGAMVVLRGKNYQGTKNLAIKCTQLKRT